jgi:4-hydroxy-3-methylbut-2-enyl diphosphate reductase
MALCEVTNHVDLVLVVGDPSSSNSNRLCEVAEKRGVRSYLINDQTEIKETWLYNVQVVAVTAGASTPEILVQQCVDTLKNFGVNEVKEITYIEENIFFNLPKSLNINGV